MDTVLITIIVPLVSMVIISLFVALLTNKSPAVICATCGMVLSILIWKGLVAQALYVVVALFLGLALWLSISYNYSEGTQ